MSDNTDGLINYVNDNDLDQDTLDYIFIKSASIYNVKLMESALKRGADINANACVCIILLNRSITSNLPDAILQAYHKLINLGADQA